MKQERTGLRLGRVLGIAIEVDWSWVFIFLLVTWSLADAVLPAWHRDWPASLRWALAVAGSLLFFVSILVHELAHSLVARAQKLPVRRITLFLFGGVSNLEREPNAPTAEFLVAVAGPVASFLLGILFGVLSGATAGAGLRGARTPNEVLTSLSPLATLFMWLGSVNVMVGLFNLIPGFPLDGGRVLRSILWGATGRLTTATRIAAAVGQVVAWIFILAGIGMMFGMRVPVMGGGFLSGMWLALIGWFLNSAAVASGRRVVVEDLLRDVPVARVMRADVPTVPPDVSVNRLIHEWLLGTDDHAFPVVEGDRLVGLVCLEDVRKVPSETWERVTVAEIMTPVERLTTASPEEDSAEALGKLTSRDVRQIPVVDHGHLSGMLRRRDIVRWLGLQGGQTA